MRPRLCFALVGALSVVVIALGASAPAQAANPGPSEPGGNGIEGAVPGWHVHAGGRSGGGGGGCNWAEVDQFDPAVQARINADPAAWRLAFQPFGGNTGFGEQLWMKAHPLVKRLALTWRDCGGAGTWIVVPVVDNMPGVALTLPGDLKFKYLRAPVLNMTPRDPEFGWVYVHVPIAVRTSSAQWRSFTVTAENDAPAPLYRYVTVTATPFEFRVKGAGGAGEDACRASAPITPYVPGADNPCSLEFKHESSTAANGRTFAVHGEIRWKITYWSSNGAGALPDIVLGTDGNIAVAAIKALVRCTTSRC